MPKLEIIATRHLPQHAGADSGVSQARVLSRSPTAVIDFVGKIDPTSVLTLWTSPLRRCISSALRIEDCAMRAGIVVSGITRDEALSETNWGEYMNNADMRAQKLNGALKRASREAVAQAHDRNATLVLVTHHPIIHMLIEQVRSQATPDVNYIGYNLLHSVNFESMDFDLAATQPFLAETS